jgi:hypothetical protein
MPGQALFRTSCRPFTIILLSLKARLCKNVSIPVGLAEIEFGNFGNPVNRRSTVLPNFLAHFGLGVSSMAYGATR